MLPFGKEGGKGRHPTQKPVSLFEYLIRMYSNPDEVVFDPFMGSGTTAVAAEASGRKYIGFEINQEYHRTSIERIKNLTES